MSRPQWLRESLRLRDGYDVALLLLIWAVLLATIPLACLLAVGQFDLSSALRSQATLPAALASLLVSLPLRVLAQSGSFDARDRSGSAFADGAGG